MMVMVGINRNGMSQSHFSDLLYFFTRKTAVSLAENKLKEMQKCPLGRLQLSFCQSQICAYL